MVSLEKKVYDLERSAMNPVLRILNKIYEVADDEDLIKTLDYFAKTLRVQDSANVVYVEGSAKKLLEYSSPLDSISSFAIQKSVLKEDGFDIDVMNKSIKEFACDYYAISSSSFMPKIKIIEQGDSPEGTQSSGSQGQEGEESSKNKTYLFDARSTALYKQGKKVGELNDK